MPITTACLVDSFAPLTLVKQHRRVGAEVVDLVMPATCSPPQAHALDRLGLPRPDARLHSTITCHPAEGCGR